MSDDTAQCGTVRGYLFHLWSGTWVCLPCEQAHAAFSATTPPGPVQLSKARKPRVEAPEGHGYCRRCRETKLVEHFRPCEFENFSQVCKPCRRIERQQRGPIKRISDGRSKRTK